ncbi:HD-GYP domain-containing protein [Bradyrhizobium canariense]|uniref:HDIG domain-containing protein n=1 Tax=Bradyrhizobium canariense TaxID=255045 RepID=A0A1H1RG01_9BRAD|nr:HD domain-containing phosphohydrolase [Bradyrhizobium canariense]SDS33829.1 HDIG domain-containing protein [Bradyrhizobium canariense]
MRIHVVSDNRAELSAVRAMLEQQSTVTSELLGNTGTLSKEIDAVVVTADPRLVENISALKRLSGNLNRIRKRVFLIDQKNRLSIVQAYALGATHVLTNPVSKDQLLAKLFDRAPAEIAPGEILSGGQAAAQAGAASIASMFSAVSIGSPIDVKGAKDAASKIADSIAEDGLSEWLATVRHHHEGTYQHCLLVTGIAVDFGLSLGLGKADIERLHSAAMFHDIGKAKIPLAVLDKPGRLDAEERALIETHPAAGYDALKGNAHISPEILDAVRHHHEYLDGSGYPDALCAESISDIVRVLTISDIFAALIEHRHYKPTMPREQAYEIIRSMQGKLEMPLVAAFKEVALTR